MQTVHKFLGSRFIVLSFMTLFLGNAACSDEKSATLAAKSTKYATAPSVAGLPPSSGNSGNACAGLALKGGDDDGGSDDDVVVQPTNPASDDDHVPAPASPVVPAPANPVAQTPVNPVVQAPVVNQPVVNNGGFPAGNNNGGGGGVVVEGGAIVDTTKTNTGTAKPIPASGQCKTTLKK